MANVKEWSDLIGNTPIVRLKNLLPKRNINVFAKLEMLNLGGSMKDRAAVSMIEAGIKEGKIVLGTNIVESSSGNMGVGLAQACCRYGLKFTAVVDPKVNRSNIQIMEAYGATIDMVGAQNDTLSNFLEMRLARIRQILADDPSAYWPNQYANENNAKAHQTTMKEIVENLGNVDYLYCATGTCGTIRGCADYTQEKRLSTKIIAVDAEGSVIFGHPSKNRLIPGHGASIRPGLYRDGMAEIVITVSDKECIIGCKALIAKESILAGGSSGGIVSALLKSADTIPDGSTVVLILPDRGERYLNTVYDKEWVRKYFPESSVS